MDYINSLGLVARPTKKNCSRFKISFFSMSKAETWHICHRRHQEVESGGANLSTWDKLVKSKMATGSHVVP